MNYERIVISNLSEAFIDFLAKDSNNLSSLLEVELSLDDQAVLWEGNNSLVVMSHKLEDAHMEHLKHALGYDNITVVVPRQTSGRLSQDILDDQRLFQEIVDIVAHSLDPLCVTQYCVTPEFLTLIGALVSSGLAIVTPELPNPDSMWIVKALDLKSGFRQLCSGILRQDCVRMPKGFSCTTVEQAASFSRFFSQDGIRCVIKPDDGEDGMGQLVFPGGLDRDSIIKRISEAPFLRMGNTIVEEYIESGGDVLSPSIEFRIIGDEVTYLFSCRQTLSPEGTFLGVDVGPRVVPESVKAQMLQAGQEVGQTLAKLGYQGFFDIDFVVGKDQTVYAVEANLRRTGATHVHAIATKLFGKDYESRVFLRSSDVDPCILSGNMSCDDVFSRLSEILYPHLGTDRGVIITVSSGISAGRLGYVVVGNSLTDLENLQNYLHHKLSQSEDANGI